MPLTTGEKVKILLGRKGMSVQDLAEKLGQTRQNLSMKIKKNNFSEKDLQKISEVFDIKYEVIFFLENGDKI